MRETAVVIEESDAVKIKQHKDEKRKSGKIFSDMKIGRIFPRQFPESFMKLFPTLSPHYFMPNTGIPHKTEPVHSSHFHDKIETAPEKNKVKGREGGNKEVIHHSPAEYSKAYK